MTQKRRRRDGERKIELPESGLAEEILATYGDGETADAAGVTPFTGREAIYDFADSLDRRAAQEARQEERPESWVTFALAGEIYGLPVTHVQEILRISTITRVPHAPTPVRGITNLRGRVLAVVDLRVRLGLPAGEIGPDSRILVAEARSRSIGLLVDAARQVLKLLRSSVQPPPADVRTERSDFLHGLVHLDRDLVILLDVEKVLEVDDGAQPSTSAKAPGKTA
jgi:purine-binding chemotaxis protein CheW